jgi:hypothetical protein
MGTGTVVSAAEGALGHFSDDWFMGNFEPFNGTVTLEND